MHVAAINHDHLPDGFDGLIEGDADVDDCGRPPSKDSRRNQRKHPDNCQAEDSAQETGGSCRGALSIRMAHLEAE